MEKIKIFRNLTLIALIAFSMSCTKFNYEDTGLSKAPTHLTMWEYMCGDSVNWYHTVAMIRHAGMEEYFTGTGQYKQITFFGITNIPILSYLKLQGKKSVTELDPDFCRMLLKRLIVTERKIMRDEVKEGNYYSKVENGETIFVEKGGELVDCVSGKIWIYTFREAYGTVIGAGELSLYMMSKNLPPMSPARVVSTNIETKNGVVQALSNTFKLTQI